MVEKIIIKTMIHDDINIFIIYQSQFAIEKFSALANGASSAFEALPSFSHSEAPSPQHLKFPIPPVHTKKRLKKR